MRAFCPPRAPSAGRGWQSWQDEQRTLVLFEAPHRLLALLEDLLACWVIVRSRWPGSSPSGMSSRWAPRPGAALDHFRSHAPQGEFTIVLGGFSEGSAPTRSQAELRQELQALVASGLSRSDAARQLSQQTGLARRELYALLHHAEEPS